MIPTRPDAKLLIRPQQVVPGEAFEAFAQFHFKRPTRVDSIQLRFRGVEVVYPSGYPNEAYAQERTIVALDATDRPRSPLRGDYELRSRFSVPAGAPSSLNGDRIRVRYEVAVYVQIPWWPDLKETFTIPVVTPHASIAIVPGHFATRADGAVAPGDLGAECALDSCALVSGGTLSGSLAFAGLRGAEIRDVQLVLQATETVGNTQWPHREKHVYSLGPTALGEREVLPFHVQIPSFLVPSCDLGVVQISWAIEVRARTRLSWETLLHIPVQMHPSTSVRAAAAPVALVGNQRRAALWASLAQSAMWHFDATQHTLRSVAADTSVVLAMANPQGHETTLLAIFRYPRLGLELCVRPRRWSDRLTSKPPKLEHEAFLSRYTVEGREHEQLTGLLTNDLCEQICSAESADMSDESLRLSFLDEGINEASMRRILARCEHIQRALALSHERVRPTHAIAEHVEAWRALARRLSGDFVPGDGALERLVVGPQRVTLTQRYDASGVGVGLLLVSRFDRSVSAWPDVAITPEKPDETRILLDGLAARGARWRCTSEELRVEVDALGMDPSDAERWIDSTASIASRIQGHGMAGPFR
ncbi:MAG: arrestin family protein [Deltaproteobacteria bacterium]|nr:arrestin family protein [Deltaproteobacteria bacterium]